MNETHKHIQSHHVSVYCYRTPHTPLGVFGKPVFHASRLLRAPRVKRHSISNVALRPPYGCRKCFRIRVQFHKFLSSAVIDGFLFTCCFDKLKQTLMTNSNSLSSGFIFIDWKDWSSRPLSISDITVSLTFDFITYYLILVLQNIIA